MLFYDPILSADSTISCASCHQPFTAFTHVDHDLSHGIFGRIGKRNSPALSNLAWNSSFMWDGAIHYLDQQSLAPISHPDEMGESMSNVVKKLSRSSAYKSAFKHAFGKDSVSGEWTLKALAQFMLSLVSSNALYDRVSRNDEGASFSPEQEKGYRIFKKHCNSCHREPLFTDGGFADNGLDVDPSLNDIGRAAISLSPSDSFKFKVPSLRNVALSYPYMHDGRFKNLQMVVFHYSDGVQSHRKGDRRFSKPLHLSEIDKRCLVAFLQTLTDTAFLSNPNIQDLPLNTYQTP
jgi:cytochrome c peroxidase